MSAIFGLGLGALIRRQVAAVVTGIAVYLGGFAAVEFVFHGIYNFSPPGLGARRRSHRGGGRSNVMVTPGRAFLHAPPQCAA